MNVTLVIVIIVPKISFPVVVTMTHLPNRVYQMAKIILNIQQMKVPTAMKIVPIFLEASNHSTLVNVPLLPLGGYQYTESLCIAPDFLRESIY